MARIVRELERTGQVKEVLIWNNDPDESLEVPGAIVIDAHRNWKCFPRYALACLARYDHLWFQDDDLLVAAERFNRIVVEYLKDQSRIYGCRGRNLRQGKYNYENAYGEVDIVIGQTMMFHRRLLRNAFAALGKLPPPTEDDIAFCLLCARKHLAVNVEPLEDLGSSDALALSRRPEHYSLRQAAVETYGEFARSRRGTLAELERTRQEAAEYRRRWTEAELKLKKLARSTTVRVARRLKRVPLVTFVYKLLKPLLRFLASLRK